MTPAEEKARDLLTEMQAELVDAQNRLAAKDGELEMFRAEREDTTLETFVAEMRAWFDGYRAAPQAPQPEQPFEQ